MSRRTRTGNELRVLPGEGTAPGDELGQGARRAEVIELDAGRDPDAGREHEPPRPAHIEGMTTLTPAKQAASLASSRRAAAATAGRPIRRTYRRGMLLAGRVRWFLFVENGKLMATELDIATAADDRVTFNAVALNVPAVVSTRQVDLDLLETVVAHAHDSDKKPKSIVAEQTFVLDEALPQISVFADPDALRAARRIATTAAKASAPGDYRAKTIAMILDYRNMLPNSGHLPVLSEALERCWWMPAGLDERNIDAWSHAFGFTGSSMRRITLLLTAALSGPTHQKFAEEVIASEKYGTASARYAGGLSANKAFRRLNQVAAAATALIDSDPMLAEDNTFTGTTTRLTLMKSKNRGNYRTFTVSDGFKMKKGAKVLVFDPASPETKPSECTIKEIGVDEVHEKVMITLAQPTQGDGYGLFSMAAENSRPLYATAAPYIPNGAPAQVAGRWTAKGDASRPQRADVPIDVVLAGAPEVK